MSAERSHEGRATRVAHEPPLTGLHFASPLWLADAALNRHLVQQRVAFQKLALKKSAVVAAPSSGA
jgi:hypothetical protein